MSLQIKTVKLSTLTPDPQNARAHDERNLDAIKNSLLQFGQRKPLVVAKANDGSLVVIAGNGTLEAAKALGWQDIAIAEVPADWDAEKARAFALADNRSAELANWNDAVLSSTLLELDAVGWDIATLGFEAIEPPTGDDLADAFGDLGKDKGELEQMTFTLHNDQAATLRMCLEVAKSMGEFGETGNPNSNGNALARIAEMWLGANNVG